MFFVAYYDGGRYSIGVKPIITATGVPSADATCRFDIIASVAPSNIEAATPEIITARNFMVSITVKSPIKANAIDAIVPANK